MESNPSPLWELVRVDRSHLLIWFRRFNEKSANVQIVLQLRYFHPLLACVFFMQGGIGIAGNRISNLGEPVQSNDAVRLSYANEFYLNRDGTNWMRGPLHAGGFQVICVGNPREETRRGKFTNTSSFSNKCFITSNRGSQHSSRRRDNKPRKHFESRHQNKKFELGPTRNSNKKFQHG